jgi:hypothetical protein
VLLAFRATFVGSFVLRVVFVLGARIVRSGLGCNVIKRAIREIVAAGFLDRRQARRFGSYSSAREALNLPPCNWKDRRTWRFVMRRWFDGTLSVNEMAAWLFLQASTGWRAATAKDVADRFGWSAPTVRKVLKALVRLKLAKREGGRYLPLSPSAVWPSESEKWLAAIAAESAKIQATVAAESEKIRPTVSPESEKKPARLLSLRR